MIDFDKFEGFDWDAGNNRKNLDKHSVTQGESEQIFFNDPLLMLEDSRHKGEEARFHALGRTDDGQLLHITFTLRRNNSLIRVISARCMSRKEREYYEQNA